MANILIIDDDKGICHVLTRTATRMGHTALSCGTLAAAEELLRRDSFDVVLLDVHLPDGSGIAALDRFTSHPSRPEIVVITGLGAADDAEQAILGGAWDYIQKSSPRRMGQALEQVLRYREERLAARPAGGSGLKRTDIVGESRAVTECLESLRHIASGDGNVLITGETGTGKELFARAVHDNSSRSRGPFVIVDCASLPDTLAESILFGHARGAFTGAEKDRAGLVREADGGTLFLDEVGELPLNLQATFLRLLQQRTFRPVGQNREEHSDFRLVAATNRDLDAMVEAGTFRPDLLFRLCGAHLALPPLRDRAEDIRPIAEHAVKENCKRLGITPKTPSQGFLDMLAEYHWPGNIRELTNAVVYAVNAAFHETTLFQAHLPRELRARVSGSRVRPASPPDLPSLPESLLPLADYRQDVLARAERHYLEQLMLLTGNDIQAASDMSGLSQSRLYALLRKFGLSTPGWKRP